MSQRSIHPSRLGVAGAYFFAFVLFFWPLVDLVTTSFPPQFGTVEWRYGFLGLTAAFLHTPILGIFLAMALALLLGHKGALRILSGLCLLGAVLLIVVLVTFALDVVQMRSITPVEARPAFQAGALIAESKHFTAFLALCLLGLGGWKTASDLSGREKASDAKSRAEDLVGMPGAGKGS